MVVRVLTFTVALLVLAWVLVLVLLAMVVQQSSAPLAVEEPPADPNEPKYCRCQNVSYGEMVACDNNDCPIEWFHFACVGLTAMVSGALCAGGGCLLGARVPRCVSVATNAVCVSPHAPSCLPAACAAQGQVVLQ